MADSTRLDQRAPEERLTGYALGFADFVSGLLPDTYEILEAAHRRANNNARVRVRNLAGIEVAIDVRVMRAP